MPRSFSELKSEIYWQYHGIRGLVEDAILKRNNRVGEYNILFLNNDRNQQVFFIDLISKEGKVAVITGGNRGIGLRVVEKLAKCDMSIIMGKFLIFSLVKQSKNNPCNNKKQPLLFG